jgi:hypothetical protein
MRTWMWAAAVVAGFVAGATACADGERITSSSPQLAAQGGKGGPSAGAPPPGHLIACERREVAVDSARIGPSGGTLRVGNNELVIPAGALKATVTIRGEVPADTIASIRLLPEGLEFSKPASLVLDAQGCAEPPGQAKVVYLDDDGAVLEEIDAYYSPKWKRVAAPINHFSRYALGV